MPRKSSRGSSRKSSSSRRSSSARRQSNSMPKGSSPARAFLNFIAWLTGIVVSLSIGFAMIGGTLTVPWWLGGLITSMIAGWVVVIATFAGVLTAIFSK